LRHVEDPREIALSLLAAWFWAKVSDRKNAQFAITEAYLVAAALAVITAILATVELMKGSAEGLGVAGLASALVFGGISFGIYRKSRISAISGLVLYLVGRGYAWVMVGPSAVVLTLLVTLAFLHGVRGTFAYHKLPPRPAGLPSLAQSFEALKHDPAESEIIGGKGGEGNSTVVWRPKRNGS
jgi:hypothetical protein